MAFVEMKDVDINFHSFQSSPATHSESYFLQHSTLWLGVIKLARDTTITRAVERMVRVQEKKVDPAHVCMPDAQQDRSSGQFDWHAQPSSALLTNRENWHHGRIVVRECFELSAAFVQDLAEVSLLKQETYSNHRNGEVARRLEKVSCQDPEATSIQSQRFA